MSFIDTFDVHCHIHETPAALHKLDSNSIAYCVQATRYTDWEEVARLKEEHGDRIVPAFGLHPWFVEQVECGAIPETWRAELRLLVKRHGGIVGECGLDKAARSPATGRLYPFEPQVALLKAQLALAHELDVPVSVHCVRAFGALADVLREAEAASTLPPRIMLHSYSGSPEMLQQLFLSGSLSTRIYVSYSHAVNGRNLQKTLQCIRVTPQSRVLAESDLHDVSTTALALDQAVEMVAEAHAWQIQEARQKLTQNARAFFGLG
ncbi:Cut9-interacting protein scn1 [Coemansia sp. RSA 2681]|nr:Cut9-interacting protein scn1 [Coemansia sp. RSA 2681]